MGGRGGGTWMVGTSYLETKVADSNFQSLLWWPKQLLHLESIFVNFECWDKLDVFCLCQIWTFLNIHLYPTTFISDPQQIDKPPTWNQTIRAMSPGIQADLHHKNTDKNEPSGRWVLFIRHLDKVDSGIQFGELLNKWCHLSTLFTPYCVELYNCHSCSSIKAMGWWRRYNSYWAVSTGLRVHCSRILQKMKAEW